MRYILLILLVMLANIASAAEIYGTVYDLYLEKQPDVRITINTTPVQYYISKDASYNFFLNQGSYSIIAEYYADYELKSTAEENITVTQEGSYVLDLILFPSISADLDQPEIMIEDVEIDEVSYFYYYLIAVLVFLLVIFYVFHINKKFKKLKELNENKQNDEKFQDELNEKELDEKIENKLYETESKIKEKGQNNENKIIEQKNNGLKNELDIDENNKIIENELKEEIEKNEINQKLEKKELNEKETEIKINDLIEHDHSQVEITFNEASVETEQETRKRSYELDELLHFIKQKDGRATQKDIRKAFPSSEAKISLMLTELEHKGLIEKIKKGRSNVIILK